MANDIGIRVCRVPDALGAHGECQWTSHELTYAVLDPMPGISDVDWLAVIRQAWDNWEAVCGVTLTMIENAEDADILVMVREIDRAGGILAESELPCADIDITLHQTFDRSEHWKLGTVAEQGKVLIVGVGGHEQGHALGLPHDQDPHSLMYYLYHGDVFTPQASDIRAAQARYGPPKLLPPPTPIPPTPVPIPPVPTPGGTMTLQLLIQLLLAFLNAFAGSTPATPPVPGQPVPPGTFIDLLRRLLGKFAGGAMTAEEAQQVHQSLKLDEVTEQQMTAPVQAMRLE